MSGRLIDADAFKKILSKHEMVHDKRRSFDDYACGAANAYEHASDLLDDMPTVERPHGEWRYLKECITDMRNADGKLSQKETCQFILNLMRVIEKERRNNL